MFEVKVTDRLNSLALAKGKIKAALGKDVSGRG
jgi:hypothetical protein